MLLNTEKLRRLTVTGWFPNGQVSQIWCSGQIPSWSVPLYFYSPSDIAKYGLLSVLFKIQLRLQFRNQDNATFALCYLSFPVCFSSADK